MSERITIVGGGVAASRVARSYRDAGGDAPLLLISAEAHLPYNRPPLSKGFLRGEIEVAAIFVEPESAYAELGVDLLLDTRVTAVDTRERRVRFAAGGTVDYGRLVLATGSRPRTLGITGEHLDGVHAYRTLDDATTVRDAADATERALVVGAGFIGMETAASLRRRGVEVTLIEPGQHLFSSLRAPTLSRSLERLYRDRGVDVILGDSVREFRGSDGRLERAVTQSGREIDAGLAIVGVGVQPTTEYLAGTDVAVEHGSVLVSERFETSVPDVYAVGDLANFHDPVFGHRRLIQHWTNANHHGERLGRGLAGEDAPYDLVAYFFSEVFGVRLGLLGDLESGHDELVVRGSLEEGKLLGLYLRDEHLVAVLVSGQTAELQNELTQFLRSHARVGDRAALADPATPVSAALVTEVR